MRKFSGDARDADVSLMWKGVLCNSSIVNSPNNFPCNRLRGMSLHILRIDSKIFFGACNVFWYNGKFGDRRLGINLPPDRKTKNNGVPLASKLQQN